MAANQAFFGMPTPRQPVGPVPYVLLDLTVLRVSLSARAAGFDRALTIEDIENNLYVGISTIT